MTLLFLNSSSVACHLEDHYSTEEFGLEKTFSLIWEASHLGRRPTFTQRPTPKFLPSPGVFKGV